MVNSARKQHPRRAAAAAAAAVAVLAFMGGCGSDDSGKDDDLPELVWGNPHESEYPDSPTDASAPIQVTIPSIDVHAPIDPVPSDKGVLTPPDDANRAGWWDAGAQPGAGKGRILVAGHKLNTGGGAFAKLGKLENGDQVTVAGEDTGTYYYAVTDVMHMDVADVAEQSAELFKTTGPERLVLVTCEDWDGKEYHANTIVIAEPI